MTAAIPWGVDSVPEGNPQFPPRSTTALYPAVRWLKIHMMESILPARASCEAARCVLHLPDAGSEEGATVLVV